MSSFQGLCAVIIQLNRLNVCCAIHSYATNEMIAALKLPQALDYATQCHQIGSDHLDSETLDLLLNKCFREYRVGYIRLVWNLLVTVFGVTPSENASSLISNEKYWTTVVQKGFYCSLANTTWSDLENAIYSVLGIEVTESLNAWNYIEFVEHYPEGQRPYIYHHIIDTLSQHKQYDLALFIWDYYFRFCWDSGEIACNNSDIWTLGNRVLRGTVVGSLNSTVDYPFGHVFHEKVTDLIILSQLSLFQINWLFHPNSFLWNEIAKRNLTNQFKIKFPCPWGPIMMDIIRQYNIQFHEVRNYRKSKTWRIMF